MSTKCSMNIMTLVTLDHENPEKKLRINELCVSLESCSWEQKFSIWGRNLENKKANQDQSGENYPFLKYARCVTFTQVLISCEPVTLSLFSFFKFSPKFIFLTFPFIQNLSLAVLGLYCLAGLSLVIANRGFSCCGYWL